MPQRYEEEFKLKVVQRHAAGEATNSLARELNIDRKTVRSWIRRYSHSGTFVKKDNMTKLEREVFELRKENKRLREENHHLQQAALILWQRKKP
jgi:transposase-like protein